MSDFTFKEGERMAENDLKEGKEHLMHGIEFSRLWLACASCDQDEMDVAEGYFRKGCELLKIKYRRVD